MRRISGIYAILNKKTGQLYIGQSNHIKRRFRDHLNDLQNGIHFSNYLQNAWNIYGEKNFNFQILEIVAPNKKLLKRREQHWMDYYKSYERDKGYNLCPAAGSTLGKPMSEETKAKLRKKALGRKMSDETKQKISKANKGLKRSKITKERLRKAFTGIKRGPMSEEHKKKISWLGRKHTKATRLKIRAANLGRKHSEKSKQKLKKAWKNPNRKKLLESRRDPNTGRFL